MGLDWDRLVGQGGAYLVERAAAVQQTGRLSPVALRLVQDEAQRLKYILDEEIARLQPAGDLTPAAIAALRIHYQKRLGAAQRVIAAAQVAPGVESVLPPRPAAARDEARPSTGDATVPLQPSPSSKAPASPAAPSAPTRSLREFFADRSILLLSYVGAFLLIVATLLFELSAFTAVDSTARFAGVLVLNAIFGLAGWICIRLPAMRLVGRTYIAIAALMVPLTFIAAWVFLTLGRYGLSRDLAIAIAGASCALLYGVLAVRLESRGYALLTLVAVTIAWGAAIDFVDVGRWRGTLLVPLVAVYLVIAQSLTTFKPFHAVFSRFADVAVHLAALGVTGWTVVVAGTTDPTDWLVITVNAAGLAIVYVAYSLLVRNRIGAPAAMVLLAAAWVAALNITDLEPLTGLLLTPLIGVYILVAYRSDRIPRVGVVFATDGEPFVHLAALLALGWTAYSASTVVAGSISQAWLLGAASLAVVAVLYAWYATLSARRYSGLAVMAALGLACFCLLNGIEIWPWRGLAFTPVMAFYVAVASRRPVIRDLFASEPEALISGAAGIAAAWSIYATATAPDLGAGSAWYPTTATLAVIALLYGLDTRLRGDAVAPALSMTAVMGASIAGVSALQLGGWRGLALTPLVALLSGVAFRGDRLGAVGKAYAGWADPFVHAGAIIAIAWSAVPALAEIGHSQAPSQQSFWYLAATFGALTLGYALYSFLSKRQSMQWTVAIGVTLSTITANQALALTSSALAVEFLVLAIAKAIVARLYRGRMHTFFYVTAAVQAVIASAIPVEQEWLRAAILVTAAAMAGFMAVDGETPEWLYLAGGFFTYGWYWLLKVTIPPPPNPGPSTLVLIFSPLPVIYAAVTIWLHRFTNRAWRLPIYVWAAAVAAGVAYLGVQEQELTILGFALLAYAAAIYLITALEDLPGGVAAASFSAAMSLLSLLQAASAAAHWYPLIFALLAWVVYIGAFLWTGGARAEWIRLHRLTGLALMALTTLACFGFSDFAAIGNPGAFSALAATWALALMLAVDARLHTMPAFDYLALVVASLASYWIAHYIGATNPQWYVAAPGLALVTSGVLLHADLRFKAPPQAANVTIGLGAAGLLGTTAIQTLDPMLSVSLYTGVLLCESIAALLVGIATRSRALVLAGAAGVALASLRALVMLIQEVPLFIVFGLTAILLLGGAAALAVLRARFADARVAMTRSWRDWS